MTSIPISFEYFPPKTEQQSTQFWRAHERLKALRPDYCSVTFGAGGSTLSSTTRTVLELAKEDAARVAPHISCQGGSREEIGELIDTYRSAGISRLVALRGDIPSGMASGGSLQHADQLVAFIRERTGDHFHIEVACYPEFHPESTGPGSELKFFRQKVEAGANSAITQYFFNPDAYFRFRDDAAAAGITCAIVPGIMPITNFQQLDRFSRICGAEIPRWIGSRLAAMTDKDDLLQFGEEVVTGLCEKLISGGAPSLHFYTLNRSKATTRICQNLDLH